MEDQEHLTDKQRRYAELLASGMPSRSAARSAGYSKSFSRVAAHRLGSKPAVAKAIEAIRTEGRTLAAYDLAAAMAQAQEGINFAKANGNAMAFIKDCELRAKLSGLLVDRVEVVTVDLRGALEAAEARVINVTPLLSNGALAGSVRWALRITGDPVAENPEAGPAVGESGRQVKNVGPENR